MTTPTLTFITHNMIIHRNRIYYFLLTFFVMVLGYSSRKFSYLIPEFVNVYLGDALWALMVFLMMGFLFNKSTILKMVIMSLTFCYGIEISQLYHADWIDAIRRTTLGGLVLGSGFLWTDIIAYSLGIVIGGFHEWLFAYFLDRSTRYKMNNIG